MQNSLNQEIQITSDTPVWFSALFLEEILMRYPLPVFTSLHYDSFIFHSYLRVVL